MTRSSAPEPLKRVVLASGNAGKLAEFETLLADWHCQMVPQSEFRIAAVEETGDSFVENALLKAHAASQYSGLPAIADDSGLEVDALAGAPGIYSARFAGLKATDEDNNLKLLKSLEGVEPEQRGARYQCALVFLRHWQDPNPIICQASWEGRILEAPVGSGGFGYDPLFYLPGLACSAAELSAADKNQLSHRGQAMGLLLAALQREFA
ncbi:MAG: RdgB/HAM1 family non-canonical purine NTP pyrophosphatase [Halieaceae bacterium]